MTTSHMLIVAITGFGITCLIVLAEDIDRRARRRKRHIRALEEAWAASVFDQALDLPVREQTILDGVREHGPVSAAELSRRVEGRDATTAFRKRLAALEERSLVTRDEKGAWVAS